MHSFVTNGVKTCRFFGGIATNVQNVSYLCNRNCYIPYKMKRLSWMLTAILTCGLMVTSCSYDDTPVQPQTDEVEALLQQMTLREKVGQLFYVRPEVLDTTIHWTTYDELMSLELQEVTIIITDAISMGAITNQYSNAEAAVGSIMAGADIVLDPRSYVEAFDAVFNAVNNGTITEERINQSVRRVLKLKRLYGLEYGK